jgi:hypothetical protein
MKLMIVLIADESYPVRDRERARAQLQTAAERWVSSKGSDVLLITTPPGTDIRAWAIPDEACRELPELKVTVETKPPSSPTF